MALPKVEIYEISEEDRKDLKGNVQRAEQICECDTVALFGPEDNMKLMLIEVTTRDFLDNKVGKIKESIDVLKSCVGDRLDVYGLIIADKRCDVTPPLYLMTFEEFLKASSHDLLNLRGS